MDSVGCYGWIARLLFWALLYAGWDEMEPRWTLGLALGWLTGWWVSSLLPAGPYLFTIVVSLTDIILVLVVFKGDVRIT